MLGEDPGRAPARRSRVGTVLAELGDGGEPERAQPGPARSPAADAEGELDRSRFFSPVVRRIADEHGIDLEQVEGHGIGGRVRKADLLAYIERRPGAERQLHTESPYAPEPCARSRSRPTGRTADRPRNARDGSSARRAGSRCRRCAGRSPSTWSPAGSTAAHCTTIVEADFCAVAARRGGAARRMARRGVQLTYLAFVARAVVAALERHPVLNASIEGDEIVHHDDVNLGIAVALEDGLIVPVIRAGAAAQPRGHGGGDRRARRPRAREAS